MVPLQKILRSVLAGVYVSIGCITYFRCENHVLGAFLFSLAPLAEVMFNLALFTGRVGTLVNTHPDKFFKTLVNLGFMWVGNLVGCVLSVLVVYTTEYRHWIQYECIEYSKKLLNYSPGILFVLGIGCNILIYTACKAYYTKSDFTGAIAVILSTMAFILCGFEHSVADGFILYMAKVKFIDRFRILIPVVLGNGVGAIIPAYTVDRYHTAEDRTYEP